MSEVGPRAYPLKRERRKLTYSAITERQGDMEFLEEIGQDVDVFLRALSRSAFVDSIAYDEEESSLLHVNARIRENEIKVQDIATRGQDYLAQHEGIKQETGAVTWRLNVPYAMSRAWKNR